VEVVYVGGGSSLSLARRSSREPRIVLTVGQLIGEDWWGLLNEMLVPQLA
jgi:hypothetical protein